MNYCLKKISLLFILMLFINPVISYGEDNIKEGKKDNLTYEEAVEKAIQNSYNLKKTEQNIEINAEQREGAAAEVISQRPSEDDIFVTEATNLNSLMNVLEKDLQDKTYDLEIEMEKENIALQVKKYFDEITLLKKQIEVSKVEVQNAKTKVDIATRRESYGLESPYNVKVAQEEYKKKQREVESLEKDLEDTYVEFNYLLGVNQEERMELDNELVFNKLEDIDIDIYVSRMISKDPSIEIKLNSVEKAEYSLNTYTYTGSNDSYNIRKIKLNQANMDVSKAEEEMEQKIRSAYNEILQLEQDYEIKLLDIAKAEEELETTEKKLSLGLVTQFELDQAKYSVLNEKLQLEQIISQHEQKKFAFERPYLL